MLHPGRLFSLPSVCGCKASLETRESIPAIMSISSCLLRVTSLPALKLPSPMTPCSSLPCSYDSESLHQLQILLFSSLLHGCQLKPWLCSWPVCTVMLHLPSLPMSLHTSRFLWEEAWIIPRWILLLCITSFLRQLTALWMTLDFFLILSLPLSCSFWTVESLNRAGGRIGEWVVS